MERVKFMTPVIVLIAGIFGGPATAAFGQQLDFQTPDTVDQQSVDPSASVVVPESTPPEKNSRVTCCQGNLIEWQNLPGSIRKMHRPGNFFVPPTGSGYYSLQDALQGNLRDKPVQNGYPPFALMPPAFYDADFRYLESVPFVDRTLSEKLKRWELNECMTFSTGGQYWARYMNEYNSRLTANNNDYTLPRIRTYGDLLIGDRLRFFGEFIWADSWGEELPALPIDANRGDFLNLFVELNMFEYAGKPVYARVGRQELLLGSQRLVSTLDWANVRRTFDGVRVFRTGEQWDFDAFYTAFVPANPGDLDRLDDRREFGGVWTTYRPQKGHFVDFFYLTLENDNNFAQQGIVRGPTDVQTIGSRYAGDQDGWLWDFWGAVQFGNQGNQDLLAGAYTASAGRSFQDALWSPTFWLCYDYASGDSNPGVGDAGTFNQIYPFGHFYLGWIDLVGRQNIHDLNAQMFFYPRNWMTVWLQYHHFRLDESRDALYNAGGVAIRRDPTGAAGRDVGDEFDVVLNFHLGRNSDMMVGYSHLFGGGFLANTPGPSDSGLFYSMFQQKW